VNARDRIGKGPWQNAKGIVVAKSVEDLHSDSNNINKQTALTENGDVVSGRGDAINMHDILTGSDPQGLYSTAGGDTTCGNWMKSSDGSAIVGHHDRTRPQRHETHEFLELLAWLARLQPGWPEGYGRRRPDLLFLGQLNAPRACPRIAARQQYAWNGGQSGTARRVLKPSLDDPKKDALSLVGRGARSASSAFQTKA
jgi:hypothetical protein